MALDSKNKRGWRVKGGTVAVLEAMLAGGLLAGCVTTGDAGGPRPSQTATPVAAPTTPAEPAPQRLGPLSVALLVPLSGPQARTGEALAEAARQALVQRFPSAQDEASPNSIRLTVYDTEGTPEGARAAAESVVADGAGLVLGPLFSVSAQSVKSVLAQAGIPALSFSNNRAVAGGGLYLLGHLPGQQTAVLLDHAVAQGHGSVAVVSPDTSYARLVAEAARAHAVGPIRLVDVQLFPANLDYNSQVQLVRGVAKTDATAVLIPTTGISLVGLSALFEYYNATLPRVRLLGTDLWEQPGTFAEGSLKGGWYVSTSTPPAWIEEQILARQAALSGSSGRGVGVVETNGGSAAAQDEPVVDASAEISAPVTEEATADGAAESNTGQTEDVRPDPQPVARFSAGPGKLQRLVMDSIALAKAWAAVRSSGSTVQYRQSLSTFLTDPAGYRGYSGLFRLLPSGLNEYGLHVLEVTRQGPRMVRAAPVSFDRQRAPILLVGPDEFSRYPWLAAEYNALSSTPVVMHQPNANGAPPEPRSTAGGAGVEGAGAVDATSGGVGTATDAASEHPSDQNQAPATDSGCRWVGTARVCSPTS